MCSGVFSPGVNCTLQSCNFSYKFSAQLFQKTLMKRFAMSLVEFLAVGYGPVFWLEVPPPKTNS